MDSVGIGDNFAIVAILIGVILLQFVLRRGRKPGATHREMVQELLLETRMNQALAGVVHQQQVSRNFMVTSWQKNKTKLGFLEQSLQVVLSDAFMMAEDFNQQVAVAKRYKSASYATGLNADRLKGLLAKSQEGLEEWLLRNVGPGKPPIKHPRVIDVFFGGRRYGERH